MVSKIGVNILCRTAKEQDILVSERECRVYYEDAYNRSIRKRIESIVSEFIDCRIEISSGTHHLKDGSVSNSILITLFNEKGFQKKELKAKIKKYINAHFKRRFDCA